jgi:hypothetical protein
MLRLFFRQLEAHTNIMHVDEWHMTLRVQFPETIDRKAFLTFYNCKHHSRFHWEHPVPKRRKQKILHHAEPCRRHGNRRYSSCAPRLQPSVFVTESSLYSRHQKGSRSCTPTRGASAVHCDRDSRIQHVLLVLLTLFGSDYPLPSTVIVGYKHKLHA